MSRKPHTSGTWISAIDMPLLDVQNLSVSFYTRNGITRAVNKVSFALEAGQTLGIVGESGSGKSVCCYSLLGLIPLPPGKIDSGTALFNGEDLLRCSAKRFAQIRGNDIAVIFQDPMTCLNPYLTVGEQLMEPLLYHGGVNRRQASKKAIEMLEEVGIKQPARRFKSYPHELSGGMRQRVMIAMALIAEPKLLICDEPTTALDVTIQAQILKLIKAIQQKRDVAVLFITHDLAVVSEVADRVVVMNNGKIVETGATKEVLANPQEAYTQKLIASIPEGQKPSAEETDAPPLIEVNNLCTWFKDYSVGFMEARFKGQEKHIKAVNDISLQIRRHEILGVVGESGSGKSTLGRSILGLTPITSGTVQYNGQDITHLSSRQRKPWRRKMQMIFQDPYASLNPRMTIFDTLAEPLLIQGLATRKSVTGMVLSLMDDVGLARSHIRKYPHEFSGGQRQRISIGRAIATKPEFIVADEPVSALDVTIQAQILDLILGLVEKHNLTMMFISHDLGVVRYIADRVFVMNEGSKVEEGSTAELWSAPQQPYTRKLLTAIPTMALGNTAVHGP
jgi:oligopeptide transport system ATP-binding protein